MRRKFFTAFGSSQIYPPAFEGTGVGEDARIQQYRFYTEIPIAVGQPMYDVAELPDDHVISMKKYEVVARVYIFAVTPCGSSELTTIGAIIKANDSDVANTIIKALKANGIITKIREYNDDIMYEVDELASDIAGCAEPAPLSDADTIRIAMAVIDALNNST